MSKTLTQKGCRQRQAEENTNVKRRGPKVRLARQLGIALTPKAAKVMENRPNPPGQHGATPRRKVSGYKKQLMEKQRLRAQYNVSERQMENSFAEATRQSGNTGVRLLQLLEMRLDAVVLRGGFVRTIYAARQAVTHGHIQVNGRKVDRPSRRLKPGDVVSIAARSRDLIAFTAPLEVAHPPAYLELDRDARSIRIREMPEREQIPIQCETSLVVEYYSR
jgi:small subunit ribosomal protein S4